MKIRTPLPILLLSLFALSPFASADQKASERIAYSVVAVCQINGQDAHLMVPASTSCQGNGKALVTFIDRGSQALSQPGGMRTFEARFEQTPGKVIRFSMGSVDSSCKGVFSIPIDLWKGDYEPKSVAGTYEVKQVRRDDSKAPCGMKGTLNCSLIPMPSDLCVVP